MLAVSLQFVLFFQPPLFGPSTDAANNAICVNFPARIAVEKVHFHWPEGGGGVLRGFPLLQPDESQQSLQQEMTFFSPLLLPKWSAKKCFKVLAPRTPTPGKLLALNNFVVCT